MVPSYRLRETREAAVREAQAQWAQAQQEYEQRHTSLQAQLEQTQRQLQALAGVSPNPNADTDAVRQQLYQIVPWLAKLEARADDLLGLADAAPDLTYQQKWAWHQYGRQTFDRLSTLAEKHLGQPLSQDGKQALQAAFIGHVSASPAMVERYAKDPTVIDEFWQMLSGGLIDPARRTAAATVQTATSLRAMPQDRPASAPAPQAAPKPKNMDERLAQAWSTYEAGKKK